MDVQEKIWRKTIPVSYTHLDVYKRQANDNQNRGNDNPPVLLHKLIHLLSVVLNHLPRPMQNGEVDYPASF